MSHAAKRAGFTLAEVLVILAIIAALAAVILPTVTNQVQKAELNRVESDFTNLRTGMEAFTVDVHRYPGDLHDLGTPISGTDADIDGTAYSGGLQSRWDGPYVDRVVASTADTAFETGFGLYILNDLQSVAYGNGVNYITVTAVDAATTEFDRLDELLDGGDGASAGRVRRVTGPPDTLKFLALPIN